MLALKRSASNYRYMKRNRSLSALKFVSLITLVAALVFIFILGPTSAPGDGPVVYWYTGIALLVLSGIAFVGVLVVRGVQRSRS
jgi:O-antigen/teichoic acid export membrane protein